jgi:hypothetical protein
MDDSHQIEPPPSFLALYTAKNGLHLTQPALQVVQRYELCEDLAQALAEQAATMLFQSNGSQAEVLSRIRGSLLDAGSAVEPAEADWVVGRRAELAGWSAAPPPEGSVYSA